MNSIYWQGKRYLKKIFSRIATLLNLKLKVKFGVDTQFVRLLPFGLRVSRGGWWWSVVHEGGWVGVGVDVGWVEVGWRALTHSLLSGYGALLVVCSLCTRLLLPFRQVPLRYRTIFCYDTDYNIRMLINIGYINFVILFGQQSYIHFSTY